MEYVSFIICSLVFAIVLSFIYFSKKHVNSSETKIFSILLVTNLIGLVSELLCTIIGYTFPPDSSTAHIFTKIYLVYLLSFMFFMTLYIYVTCYITTKNNYHPNYYQKLKNIFFGIFVFCVIVMLILPIKTDIGFATGAAVDWVYACSTFCFVTWPIPLVKNRKRVDFKKFIPLFCFIALTLFISFLQKINPHLTLTTSMEFLIIFIMYFTIENPDIKMIEGLNVARTHAERANLAKSEFLSSMSHEIRTPLNAIVGFSDCILRENDIQATKEDAKDIITASKNLLEIVNGILDISKIEANKMEITETDYNPKETIYSLVKLVVPRIGEKPIEMKVGITQDLPKVLHGDVKKVKQIITNILTNAVKYTDKGTITVMVTCLNQNDISLLSISVEDTGRGIKPEKIDKLFTKFERLDEDRNTTIEGTGLGLAITKRLVEMMGGKIIVQSKFGEGSKFTVYLKQRISDKKEVVEEKKPVVAKHYPGKKILVVDDNKINLKVATKILKELEISVEEVDNGFSCIDKIQNGESYDMILLDDMMPRMSGSETLVQLKKIPDFSIPVVMLTANAIEGMKEEYLKKGFDDYLAKPISRKELYRVLSQYLGTHEEVENKNKIDFGPLPQEIFEFETTIKQGKITYDLDYLKSKGIDVDKGLSLLADEETYREMMMTFYQEIAQKQENMKKFISDKNTKEYAVLAHGIKSDAKYFGFTALADIAYQHELKGKDNDIDFITKHQDEFDKEINQIKEIIQPYLDK